MFSLEEILAAHQKVKSGADFPNYIKEIKALGVTHYETSVTDGHSTFYGTNNYKIEAPAKFEMVKITTISNKKKFTTELLTHQQGKTDFLTFIKSCAEFGIEKWEINMSQMTCTYYDRKGLEILMESIPQ